MTFAHLRHPTKQHLGFTFPWHLGEFVHGGDQQRRRSAVDFLIHDHDRETLSGGVPLREFAAAQTVATIGYTTANVAWRFIYLQVLFLNLASAPWAGGDLVWGSGGGWLATHIPLTQS